MNLEEASQAAAHVVGEPSPQASSDAWESALDLARWAQRQVKSIERRFQSECNRRLELDESWLQSIGFAKNDAEVLEFKGLHHTLAYDCGAIWLDNYNGEGDDNIELRDLSNRGQLLDLMSAIGIEFPSDSPA